MSLEDQLHKKGVPADVIKAIKTNIAKRSRAEEELAESHKSFKAVLDGLHASVYVADMESYEILFANKQLKNILGNVTGGICWQVLQKGLSGPCDFCTNDKLLTPEGKPAGVYSWKFQNSTTGSRMEILNKAIRWVDGRTVRLEIAEDITKRTQAEEGIRQLNNYLDIIANTVHEGLIVIEEDYTISYVNETYARQMGVNAGKIIGQTCFSVSHHCEEKSLPLGSQCPMNEAIKTKLPQIFTYHNSDKDGNSKWFEVSAAPIINRGGEVTRLVEVIRDITERKKYELTLKEMSVKDGLTGLYNYSYFQTKLDGEIARYRRNNKSLSLMMLDLDKLKNINDKMGHLEGDKVLVNIADIINKQIRQGIDTVARYGGDEFVLILPETSIEEAKNVAERIIKTLNATVFNGKKGKYKVTISAGLSSTAELSGNEKTVERIKESMIDYADQALYFSKNKGGNLVSIFHRPN